MTSDEQLRLWVAGDSRHNVNRDECCPDFSCCNPDFLADLEVRERFAQAIREGDEKTKMSMIGMFLGNAMAAYGKKVHIAGDEPGETQ